MAITNTMRTKMQKGEKVIGAFSNLGCTAAIECLGLAGLDFVIIDTEHGTSDVESVLPMILAAERWNITPLVRVKDASRSSILKMLDIGAMGLVVPFIKTIDEVKQIVEYGKYAPLGQRGFGQARKSGFATFPESSGPVDFFEACNRETLLIPQCETAEALGCIEEITALEGVDGIFLGPFDLSIAMGIPVQFDHPEFVAAVEKTVQACKTAGKFCITLGVNSSATQANFARGFDGVATSDISFLLGGAQQYLKDCKA